VAAAGEGMSAQSDKAKIAYDVAHQVKKWEPMTAHFVRKVDEGVIVFCGKIAPADAVKAERYLQRLIKKVSSF
jgi:hypothetical protein